MSLTKAAEQVVIRKLWDYGHFRRPEEAFSESHNVAEEDLPSLRLEDSAAQEAVLSYQKFFEDDLSDLCLRYHNRATVHVDGEVGPATFELIQYPRCGVPEFAGVEEANWPTDCRGSLTFAYEMSLSGLSKDKLRDLVLEMARVWSGALEDVTIRLIDSLSQAKIWARGRALPGGTLAWSHLARNTCNTRLEQAYDTTITWADDLFVTTCCHEVGHALGLPHNNDRNALMYPSINPASRQRRGFPNATDLQQCRSIGYKVASSPSPTPPPGPGPPDKPSEGAGIITLGGKLYALRVDQVIT